MNQVLIAAGIANVMRQARATGLFHSLATITAPSGDLTAGGSPDGVYIDVPGLVAIPAMDAPFSVDRFTIMASENRAVPETTSTEQRHVLLNDFYPQLSPETNWGEVGWKCTIDGVLYDIAGGECDSQRTQTRLKLIGVTV